MVRSALALLAGAAFAAALAACGGGGDSSSEGFVADANTACTDTSRGVADANLRIGVATTNRKAYEQIALQTPPRQRGLDQLRRLEAPGHENDLYGRFLTLRKAQIEADRAQVRAFRTGDKAGGDRAATISTKSTEGHIDVARRLGLKACALQLPPDDTRRAEAAFEEYETTDDPRAACNELITPQFVEALYGDRKGCVRYQRRHAGQFARGVKFGKVQGVDDIAAILDFQDVGGYYDGVPSNVTLYHLDGSWKVYVVKRSKR